MMTAKPAKRLIVSVGEPAGIGPDLAVQLAGSSLPNILWVADPKILHERAKRLGVHIKIEETSTFTTDHLPDTLQVYPLTCPNTVIPGQLNPNNADYVLRSISTATNFCLKNAADAMITGPVHKGVINDAGIPFSGHTGFIAKQCNTEHVVMMLSDERTRVALHTTHIPLKDVPAQITESALITTLTIVQQDLQQHWNLPRPKIAVCGLNPHAGEGGHIGQEELKVITPTIDKLNHQGFHLIGPLSADTLFHPDSASQYDAIVAMYHDQGLGPLKAQSFGEIVNVTLGLPIIRTSVDHGTALAIAGSGQARTDSLLSAIHLAGRLCG